MLCRGLIFSKKPYVREAAYVRVTAVIMVNTHPLITYLEYLTVQSDRRSRGNWQDGYDKAKNETYKLLVTQGSLSGYTKTARGRSP